MTVLQDFAEILCTFWSMFFLQLSLWWFCSQWYQAGPGTEGQRAPTELGKVSCLFPSGLLWVDLQYCIIEVVFNKYYMLNISILVLLCVWYCVYLNTLFITEKQRCRMNGFGWSHVFWFLYGRSGRSSVWWYRNSDINYLSCCLANNHCLFFI